MVSVERPPHWERSPAVLTEDEGRGQSLQPAERGYQPIKTYQ